MNQENLEKFKQRFDYGYDDPNGGWDQKSYIGLFFKGVEHYFTQCKEFYMNGYVTVRQSFDYYLENNHNPSSIQDAVEQYAFYLYTRCTKLYYYQGPRGIAAFEEGVRDQLYAIYMGLTEKDCQEKLEEAQRKNDERSILRFQRMKEEKVYDIKDGKYHISGVPTDPKFKPFNEDMKQILKKFNKQNNDMFAQPKFQGKTLEQKLELAVKISVATEQKFKKDIGDLINKFSYDQLKGQFQSSSKISPSIDPKQYWHHIKFLRIVNKFFSENTQPGQPEFGSQLDPVNREKLEIADLQQLVQAEKKFLLENVKNNSDQKLKLQVKDILRGRMEVNDYKCLKEAVLEIANKFEILELENKMVFDEIEAKKTEVQNVSMVIKYPIQEDKSFVFAEIQIIPRKNNQTNDFLCRQKINHFLYEIKRHKCGAMIALTEMRDEYLEKQIKK